MNKVKIKNKIKALLCLCLSVVIAVLCIAPASAAVTYPDNVTRAQAVVAIDKADIAVKNILKQTMNTSLRKMILPEIYSDNVLNSVMMALYGALEKEAGTGLLAVGINTTPSSVASSVVGFGNVSKKLRECYSWAEVNTDGIRWGVNSKKSFSQAVASMFGPFSDVLYALLCGKSYYINPVLSIKGDMGYETAIIPTLEALGCKNIKSPDKFYADAASDKKQMMYSIAYDLITMLEGLLDTPCSKLTEILPSVADYLVNGGFDKAVATLVEPLNVQVFNIATVFTVQSFLNFISDSQSYTQNFTLNFNDILSGTGLKMANIDLNLLSTCGKKSGNKIVSDKPDTFIIILRWIVDTLKLNKDSMLGMVSGGGEDFSKILSGILDRDTDSIVSLFVSLFNQREGKVNEYQWVFNPFTPISVAYTPNLTADKYQRVAENIDGVLNDLVIETGEEKSLRDLLRKEIYSSKTLSMILKGIFSAFEDEQIKGILPVIGLDVSPKAIGKVLRNYGFVKAAKALEKYKSWTSMPEKGIDWGFRSGERERFFSLMVASFMPMEKFVGMLLAEDKVELFGSVRLYGSNGYNTAIIPVYEALGCAPETIKTYDEYKALYKSGRGIEALLSPFIHLIDRVIERPVYTLLQILPNALNFIDGSLVTCLENLIYPFNEFITELGLEGYVNFDTFKNLEVRQLLTELFAAANIGVSIPQIDVTTISAMGTETQMTSKRTLGGQFVQVPYIQADMPALAVSLMRILAGTFRAPENDKLLTSLVNTGLGESDEGMDGVAKGFVNNIILDIKSMTEDETVEWFYKLFFRERVVSPKAEQKEEYLPTVIYRDKTDLVPLIIFIILVAVAVYLIKKNREKLEEYIAEWRWRIFGTPDPSMEYVEEVQQDEAEEEKGEEPKEKTSEKTYVEITDVEITGFKETDRKEDRDQER